MPAGASAARHRVNTLARIVGVGGQDAQASTSGGVPTTDTTPGGGKISKQHGPPPTLARTGVMPASRSTGPASPGRPTMAQEPPKPAQHRTSSVTGSGAGCVQYRRSQPSGRNSYPRRVSTGRGSRTLASSTPPTCRARLRQVGDTRTPMAKYMRAQASSTSSCVCGMSTSTRIARVTLVCRGA